VVSARVNGVTAPAVGSVDWRSWGGRLIGQGIRGQDRRPGKGGKMKGSGALPFFADERRVGVN